MTELATAIIAPIKPLELHQQGCFRFFHLIQFGSQLVNLVDALALDMAAPIMHVRLHFFSAVGHTCDLACNSSSPKLDFSLFRKINESSITATL